MGSEYNLLLNVYIMPYNARRILTTAPKGTMKLNSCLLKSTVVAALGGLLFGFDTAVIAGTTHALTKHSTSRRRF